MTGKHIEKALKTYIQANNESYKAFKLIEPLISLTKTNGGSQNLAKQLEEFKKEAFKRRIFEKLLDKVIPKADMAKALKELASELGIESKDLHGIPITSDSGYYATSLEDMITTLAQKLEAKELKQILDENGNGNNHS